MAQSSEKGFPIELIALCQQMDKNLREIDTLQNRVSELEAETEQMNADYDRLLRQKHILESEELELKHKIRLLELDNETLKMTVRHQEATIRSYKGMMDAMTKMGMSYAPIQLQRTLEVSDDKRPKATRLSVVRDESESLTNSIVSP